MREDLSQVPSQVRYVTFDRLTIGLSEPIAPRGMI
jgi:hypothetical protein